MDPYAELVKVMRIEGAAQNPMGLMLGKVVSIEPLRVSVGGVELGRDSLLVDENIITERAIETTDPLITGKVTKTLDIGDSLVVTQFDDTKFLVISKVI